MKNFLVVLALLLGLILPAKADVMPYYLSNINSNTIGVYQVSHNIKIFKEPNEKSPLLVNVFWDSSNFSCLNDSASNLFLVFFPAKDLAFIQVLDENENGDWIKVIYNKNNNASGWIKKEDDYRFLPWRIFYNWYGHKYGLYYFKDAPDTSKAIYGTAEDQSKVIGRITMPQSLNVTAIRGNWALIGALDIDHMQKIGWVKWRDISGQIYLFPNIK